MYKRKTKTGEAAAKDCTTVKDIVLYAVCCTWKSVQYESKEFASLSFYVRLRLRLYIRCGKRLTMKGFNHPLTPIAPR